MRISALTGTLAALAVHTAALAHPHDVEVDWVAPPSASHMARHFPRAARNANISGWAVVLCVLQVDGRVKRCRNAGEAPEGYGFGDATVAASNAFRMKAKTADGRSAAGEIIVIPLSWKLPGSDAPPRTYAPGEPVALVTAIAPQNALLYSTAPCPPPEAERQCPTLKWARQPSSEDLETLVRRAGDEPSIMQCTVAETGLLRACEVAGGSPETRAELLKVSESFEAPPLALDRTPTIDKRVALTFDWKAIRRYLDAHNALESGK